MPSMRHPSFLLSPLLAAALLLPAAASAREFTRARGFRTVSAAPGVTLLRRGREYVQAVDPAVAHVRLVQDNPTASGAQTLFVRRTVPQTWALRAAAEPRTFSAVNGQFFNMRYADSAALAFSVRADGKVYAGYGDRTEYLGRKRLLVLGEGTASVEPYGDDPMALETRGEPQIIVGLATDAPKAAGTRLGRTLAGVTRDGWLLLFSSPFSNQRRAERLLQGMGVPRTDMVLFDGADSSQLVTRDGVLVRGSGVQRAGGLRKVPQAIVVEAGE